MFLYTFIQKGTLVNVEVKLKRQKRNETSFTVSSKGKIRGIEIFQIKIIIYGAPI